VAATPTFDELLRAAEKSAVHLETRDGYSQADHAYKRWRAGDALDPSQIWPQWFDLVGDFIRRGGRLQRARIVSEPVSDYIRYEHSVTTALNLAAGEDVRWLPRQHASDLALPGNDFWLFDDRLVLWNYFDGNGEPAGKDTTDDPAMIKLCSTAFLAVWERATPHADYRPR
jgi:hypothetical protein